MASSDLTQHAPKLDPMSSASPLARSDEFGQYQISWKVWAIWLGLFSVLSMMFVRDVHFDFAHYYVQNGWSLVNGRLDRDFAPAELHSFLNPLHAGFIWLLIDNLPGPLVIGVVAFIQGLALPILYALTARIAYRLDVAAPRYLIMAIALSGFFCQSMIFQMASIWNDYWGPMALFVALALLIGKDKQIPDLKAVAAGALLVGLMFGMKLTNVHFVAGFAVAVLIAVPGTMPRIKAVAAAAIAGGAATIATGGWWLYIMWAKFGNPMFPLMNSVFPSPQGPSDGFRDDRFMPDGPVDGLLRPFQFSFDATSVNEFHFTDFRFLLAYIACFIALGILGYQASKQSLTRRSRTAFMVVASFMAVFLVWTVAFSIQRYAMGLWMVGPTLIMAVVWYVRPDALTERTGRLVLAGVVLGLLITTSTLRMPPAPENAWNKKYIWAELPANVDTAGAIIVLSSNHPTAFMAPAFERAAWLTHADARAWSKRALDNYRPQVKAAIQSSTNPIFGVLRMGEADKAEDLTRLAAEYDLTADIETCEPIKTSISPDKDRYLICPLAR